MKRLIVPFYYEVTFNPYDDYWSIELHKPVGGFTDATWRTTVMRGFQTKENAEDALEYLLKVSAKLELVGGNP